MQENNKKQVLLVGNPNVGKSTVFNCLCNKKQKTGNYAGVTVSSHSGNYTYKNQEVEVVDLPGSYSIYPNSEDEAIFSEFLLKEKYNFAVVKSIFSLYKFHVKAVLFNLFKAYFKRFLFFFFVFLNQLFYFINQFLSSDIAGYDAFVLVQEQVIG